MRASPAARMARAGPGWHDGRRADRPPARIERPACSGRSRRASPRSSRSTSPRSPCPDGPSRSPGPSGATGSRSAGWASSRSPIRALQLARAVARAAARGRTATDRSPPSRSARRPGSRGTRSDGPETFDAVELGYLIAPADVALWAPRGPRAPRRPGRVEAIVIAPDAEGPMVRVERAAAHAGRGLEGDRYFEHRGTFSNAHGRGHDLTLIEAEVLDALDLPGGRLAPEEARRNVVTRGIDLNALVGQRFRIGEVECFGQRLCEPCAHLERLTAGGKPGTLRALIHKGGLRADLLSDGEIARRRDGRSRLTRRADEFAATARSIRQTSNRRSVMGEIHVHEFMSLDGVIDAPTWTFDYGFDPKMGEALGAVTARGRGHPARAHDVRDVRAGVVDADRRGRSRGAVLQRHDEVRRLRDADRRDVAELEDRRAVRPRRDPRASRTRSTATSTSAAAARSSGRCSPTA